MRAARLRVRWFAAVALPFVLALPDVAKADAISVKWLTTVPAGRQPSLTITANQPLEKVEVLFNRDDGKLVDETIGELGAGGSRDVMLDGAVGKHKYSGHITCVSNDVPIATQLSFETVVAGVLTVGLDKARVDLVHGRLELQVSIPEGKVELKIISATDGATLIEHEQPFSEHDPRDPLIVEWNPLAKGSEVGRVDVRVSDATGAAFLYSLFPWQVYIPHEEVVFATDSAAIARTETPKLQASLAKIADVLDKHKDLGAIKLYVAGHTDTVGAAKYNLGLSLKRAQSIAGWFRKNGLGVPIAFEGFGEQALRIGTPDNTDEPRNRRVDYILSVEDPVLKATDFHSVWKTIK